MLFDVIEFGMNAQDAVEAPRFQTRHLVSSFDNHAMNPGDLLLDERIAPAVALELAERRHKIGTRSRWASGAAPVLIRVMPDGAIEAGADPYGYRTLTPGRRPGLSRRLIAPSTENAIRRAPPGSPAYWFSTMLIRSRRQHLS